MGRESGNQTMVASYDFRRVEKLERLLEVTRMLNSSLRLEEVLELVIEQAMAVAEAEAGTLWLLAEEGRVIIPFVARGPKADALKGLKLAPGEGMAGQVIASGQPVLVADVAREPQWAKRFDQSTGFVTRSLFCVPLSLTGGFGDKAARQQTIGCLQLVNKTGNRFFDNEDLEICLAFAGQAAVSLENSRLHTAQQKLLLSLIRTSSSALDARDPYTSGHSERVARYALLLAEEFGLPRQEAEILQQAAMLHDIGKIGVRDDVLLFAGPLSPDAWEKMKSHSSIGAEIIRQMEPPELTARFLEGALYHHEKYNGSGYPTRKSEDDIPLFARIIAIADTYDAITTERPYKKAFTREEALTEIERCAGTHFDPRLVSAFVRAMRGLSV